MINFTTCANVANSFLKVLQGYTKGIRFIALLTMLCTIGVGQMWGAEEEVYSADFTTVSTHSYTQDKTFTLTSKSWTSSVSQVASNVFYLGCNSNNASKGILANNSTFSEIVTALKSVDAKYSSTSNAHAYALLFDNAYDNVTKVNFAWSGGNNAFQVYLFGYTNSAWVSLSSTNYATSGTAIAGSVEWKGDATNYTKFAVVARPGTTSSTATNKTLRASTFKIYTDNSAGTPETPEKTATSLEWSAATYTATIDGANTFPTLTTTPANLTGVTYSSSNTAAATINASTGAITLVAAGTTTITASYAGNETYEAAENATYTLTVEAAQGAGGGEGECSWEETAIGNIKGDDIVVITMTNNDGTSAMSNSNGTGSAPTATKVTVSGTKLTGTIADNLKWNISNSNGTLTIYPNEATSTWLYCTAANNGVRVGTNANKTFTIDATSGYLKNTATSRYLGVYNSQDWRCYTSTTTNIANQTLKFYVYKCSDDGGDDPEPEPDPVDPEVTFSDGEYTVGGAALDLSTLWKSNSTGAVTYSVKTDGGTGATINGTSFTATAAGTCIVQASQDATATYNAATATATITVTAPAPVEGTWTLVTDAASLKVGDEIVIASNTTGKVAAALSSDYLGEFGVQFSNDKSTITALPATALIFTLGGSAGSWTLTNDGKSLGATAVKKLAWNNGTTTWSISIADNNATIQNATDTYGRFLHNVQSTRFSTYTSNTSVSMLLPQIYKKGGNTPAPTKLGTPDGLKADKITSSSATLSWNAVANASSYTVEVYGENDEVIATYENIKEATQEVTNLEPSTNYIFGVTAIGDDINYTNSDQAISEIFATLAATTPTASYTIIHSRQALDDTYPDALIIHTQGTAEVGSTITAEKKTYTGFVCDDEVQTITIQADAAQNVVTYKYVRQSYTLTWDLDGGTIVTEGTPAGTVKYEAPLTAPEVEKAGYRFDHWYPNVPATMQDGNRTYKAFYTQQHTVKWVSQGTVIRTDTYDTGAALEAAPTTGIVECDGKKHVGWTAQGGYAHSTAAPADLFTESSGTVTADATYYAVYAEGNGGGGTGWTAVTSTSDLKAGATYAISSAATGGTYLSTWDGGNNFDGSTTTICPLVLGGETDAWTFQISYAGTYDNYYLTATNTTDKNYLKAVKDADNYSKFTISFNANNAAEITCAVKDTRNILRYNANNGSPIFACYSSGQSDVYLQKQTGGGGYTNYTTSCASITSIRIEKQTTTFYQYDAFNFGGKVYAIDEEDNETDVTELATFTGYDMSQAGTQTVTVSYSGCSVTYEITVNKLPVWNITWSVGGKTSTGIGPREVIQGKTIGECSSTGDLQTPSVDCDGKVFIGWTESNTVPTDGIGIAYIDKNTKPDSDKTYYAVFATKEVGDGVALTKCNGSTTFKAGDNIVIVALGDGWSYLCYQKTSGTTYITNKEFTNDAVTLIKDDKNYWTLEAATSGFYLGDATNGYMYIPSSNNLNVSTEHKSIWAIEWNEETSAFNIKSDRWLSCRSDLSDDNKYKWRGGGAGTNGTFNLQIYKISGSTTYTDYSTSCGSYTVTYYGFTGGYSTTCNENRAVVEVPQGDTYQIPNCEPTDYDNTLNRTFAGKWNTAADGSGTSYEPGETIEYITSDITLYAQWTLNTTGNITLHTNVDDLANTDIVVNGGNTLTLAEGTTTIKSLTLKGGLQSNGSYAMPVVVIPDNATLVRKDSKIHLDLTVNNRSYYPFAVPFEVEVSTINYADPTLATASEYGSHYNIITYNGARRATNGESSENWRDVEVSEKLQPGVGYAISAIPVEGKATIRISMTPNKSLTGEQEKSLSVTAHGKDTNIETRHKGWNFVANPYLSNFGANGNISSPGYINGQIIINGGYSYGGENVPYVTIPNANMSSYEQCPVSEAILSPMYGFFVQIGTTGEMTFTTAGRQQAPAALRASSEHANPSFNADIVILNSQEQEADHTGLVINDRWTPAYEIGGDLEKMFGTANKTAIYTLSGNTRLAYNALSYNDALVAIPVGFRAQADGEYTLQLRNAEDIVGVECIELKDLYNNQTTNLLYTGYTFYTDATQDDSRFVVYIVPQKNTPTDISTIINGNTENGKIIFNNHLYIIHNGSIYNGNGQIVK